MRSSASRDSKRTAIFRLRHRSTISWTRGPPAPLAISTRSNARPDATASRTAWIPTTILTPSPYHRSHSPDFRLPTPDYHRFTYNIITHMSGALKPSDFHVLLTLSAGPRHGYGIMKEVELESGGEVRLEIGSLYRLLGRLLDEGLIEEAGGDDR